MKKDAPLKPIDFHKAASLYSIGLLSIGEASTVAESFRTQQYMAREAEISSSQRGDNTRAPTLNNDLEQLRSPSLQRSATASVMALAQGLLRETVDPLQDIWEVRNFIRALSVSGLLSEPEYERAGTFVVLGNEQAQLWDRDEHFASREATELREQIRQAAIEYVSNPLNKDPEP